MNIPPPPPPPPNAQPLPSPPYMPGPPPGPNHFQGGNPFSGGPPTQMFGAMNLNGPQTGMRPQNNLGGQLRQPIVPTLYELYQLKKEDPNLFNEEPNWGRVTATQIAVSQEELIKMIKKQKSNGEGSSMKDYQKLRSDNQRAKIDRLVEEKKATEQYQSNADWIFVSIEDVRGPTKNKRDMETKKINVIVKRYDKTRPSNSKGRTNSTTSVPRPSTVTQARGIDLNDPFRPGMGIPNGPPGGPRNFNPNQFPPNGPNGPMRPGPGPHQMPQYPGGPPPPQHFGPPHNFPPPPMRQPGPPMQRMPPDSPDSDEIVTIVEPGRPPMNRSNSMNRPFPQGPPNGHMPRKSSMKKQPRPIVTNGYDSSNESEESTGFSRGSNDRSTPLSTPTSGGGGIPRDRRFSSDGVDFMVNNKKYSGQRRPSQGRRPSFNARDSYDEIPHRNTGGRRDSVNYNKRPSDALIRKRNEMEDRERERELDHLELLERVRTNERRRIDETMKEMDAYERRRRQLDEYERRTGRDRGGRDRSSSYDRRSTGRYSPRQRSPDRARRYTPERYPPPRRNSSYRGAYD